MSGRVAASTVHLVNGSGLAAINIIAEMKEISCRCQFRQARLIYCTEEILNLHSNLKLREKWIEFIVDRSEYNCRCILVILHSKR